MAGELVLSHPRNEVAARDFMPTFSIDEAIERRNIMVKFVKGIMVDGTDFGKIPGTDKDVLLKPGAEKLCTFFGLSPEFILSECVEDWTGADHKNEPFFYYRYKCRLTKNGHIIGEADGSANSWESKYRYRWVQESQVPEGMDKSTLAKKGGAISEPAFAIEKGETGGKYGKPADYWQRFRDAIHDGTARSVKRKTKDGKDMEAWEVDSTVYRIPNPDVADTVNTLQKMSQKRSLVGAALVGVNASEYFTQDVDDMQEIQQQARHIDTGGAPVGTQAAADNVAKRKIEDARKATPPPQQTANVDKEIQALWQEMYPVSNGLKRMGVFKADYVEITGTEAAYYGQLNRHGVKHANEFKTLEKMRHCARDMYQELKQLASMSDAATEEILDAEEVTA